MWHLHETDVVFAAYNHLYRYTENGTEFIRTIYLQTSLTETMTDVSTQIDVDNVVKDIENSILT
jgi:hypothetical protein